MATNTQISTIPMKNEKKANFFSGHHVLSRIGLLLIAVICTFIALGPFAFAVSTSFKTQADSIDGTVIPFVQFQPTMINWEQEFGLGGGETFKGPKQLP
ncbi:MAG: hypothetical protein R3E39_09695 [Anaerolineae bacterium]